MTPKLKAPFPWFGGKSRVADLVWDRFGNTPNYVEPFAGSLAVLLARPHEAKNETVNDKDAYLANFWRATAHDPEKVAHFADSPVNEADLHARHQWLVDQAGFRERMLTDPDYFDAKIAGWWVWGISQWIGDGWCKHPEWRGRGNASKKPQGIQTIVKKRPTLGNGGLGVHRKMADLMGKGIIIHQDGDQSGVHEFMALLAERLKRVRVCCGDWSRILGPTPTIHIGLTGVFLDPPYSVEDRWDCYNEDSRELSHAVRAWALEHEADHDLRIALCGYEGEHVMPESWEVVRWKAKGGYANQTNNPETTGKANAHRERIWFSPSCLKPGLFGIEDSDSSRGVGTEADITKLV